MRPAAPPAPPPQKNSIVYNSAGKNSQSKNFDGPKVEQPKIVDKFLNPSWQAKNEKDLQEMSECHEKLINMILTEEEELIATHRGHIDSMVGIIKSEMGILHDVDQPGSDVDEYTNALRTMLDQQANCIISMKSKLDAFTSHLRLEEEMCKKFYRLQSEILDLDDNQ